MQNLISLDNVVIGYDRIGMLDPISLTVESSQFWGVLGPNGSGKTTLLKTMLNLISPVSGNLVWNESLVLGYVPQNEKFDTIFPISVEEIVSMGRYSRVGPGKKLSINDYEIVERKIESVGISHLKDRTFRSLSGGEQQRALLARAIVGEPDVIVLDEPTASVDIKGETEIMELVKKIQGESKASVLMVSHFLNTVAEYSDHLILVDKDSNSFHAGEKTEILNKVSLDKFFGLSLNLN